MDIRILGPLSATAGGQPIALGGRRTQIILAVLALESNRVVPRDRLIKAVWDDDPPATARSQLQICVSTLRRAFGVAGVENAIVTAAPGYSLCVGPGQLDAAVFTTTVAYAKSLAAEDKLSDAAAGLRRALDLWRGPALAGLTGRIVQAGALALDESRLIATEERVRLELAIGRHDELIGELCTLVGEHPLRERLHAQLMLALYRSGRQAEALRAYRQARVRIIDELGVEPGAELRRLEHAILVGSDDLEPRISVPTRSAPHHSGVPIPYQLPADIPDFTGHRETVAHLVDLLGKAHDETSAGAVTVIGISGPGGVGKSALAVHAAHRVHDDFPDGQLYAHLAGSSAHPVPMADVLGRFLRGLGLASPTVPKALDEQAELFRSRLADRRVLILLDDVADDAHIRLLLPGSASCRVLVTSRSRLPHLPAIHRIELTVLDPRSAVTLLGRVAGTARVTAEPLEAQAIAELCECLPLALRIAGARLAARPHWPLARLRERLGDSSRRLDELERGDIGVRASLSLSYRALSPAERRLLRRLAVLDIPELGAWAGAAVLDVGLDEAEEMCERLVEAQLLTTNRADRAGPVRYRHPELVRVFARERAHAEESTEHLADAIRRAFAALLFLASEAHRREYGGDFTILHGKAPTWPLPQSFVDDLLTDPVAWLDSERSGLIAAVRQTTRLGWDECCWDLALTANTLFEARGYYSDWNETTQTALEVCRAAANIRGEAAMLHSLGALRLFERRFDEAGRLGEQALAAFERCGDSHGGALVLRNLAHLDRLTGQPARARERYDTALAGLTAAGDVIGRAHVLSNVAGLLLDQGDREQARDVLTEAIGLCRTVGGGRRVESQILYRLGEVYLEDADVEHAAEMFARVLRIVRHAGDRTGEAYALLGLGLVRHRGGHHDQATICLSEALAMARRTGERFVEGRVLHALGDVDLSRDRAELAVERFAGAARVFGEIPAVTWQERSRTALAETLSDASVGVASGDRRPAGGRRANG